MLSKGQDMGKRLEELELTFPPESSLNRAISSDRMMISDKTCSPQSKAALGEHQRHSRATGTGIRLVHTTITELLGLQVFALAILIYLYFTYFLSLFSNKGF